MSLMLKALQQLELRNAPHPRPAEPLSSEEVAEVARRTAVVETVVVETTAVELATAESAVDLAIAVTPVEDPVPEVVSREPAPVPVRRSESAPAIAPVAVDQQLGEIESIVARQLVEDQAAKVPLETIAQETLESSQSPAAIVSHPVSETVLEQSPLDSAYDNQADHTTADSRAAEIEATNAQNLSIIQSAPKVSFVESFRQSKSVLPSDVHPSVSGSAGNLASDGAVDGTLNSGAVHEAELCDEVQQVDTIPLAWSAWRHRVIADLRQPQLHQQIRELAETVGRQLADSHHVVLLVSPTPDPAVARIAGHLVAARAQRTDGRTLLVAAGPSPELPDGLTEAVAQPDLGWEGNSSPEPRLAKELFPGVDLLMIPWASDMQGEAQAIESAIALLVNLRNQYALTAIAGGSFDMPNLQWWCSVCDGAMLVVQAEVSNFAGTAAAAKWIRRQQLPLLGSVVTGHITRSA